MATDANWDILANNVRLALKNIEKGNITHAEAFFTSSETTEVVVRNSEIFTQNKTSDSGVGFRVVVPHNKVGFACTNSLSERITAETAERAYAIAKASSEVYDFDLPEQSQIPSMSGLFDSNVVETTIEEAVDVAKRAVASVESTHGRVIVKDGRVFYSYGHRGVINNHGVDVIERETKSGLYLITSGEENDQVTSSCVDLSLSRRANLEPEQLGRELVERTNLMFNPRPTPSFKGKVIFAPQAVSYQICDVLIDALKAENVLTSRSNWTQKVGQRATSDNLTIVDDATFENGFASRSFDDEGYPSQRTFLLRKGVLESFLHDSTSAKALGRQNTGNASRFAGGFEMVRMIIGNGYKAKPEIYPSTLTLESGTKTKEQLMSEIDEGALVESMAGFAQGSSGVISAQLSNAFYVKNGDIQYPIKGGMVSGSGFDWLKQIISVGRDAKQFQNAFVPSLLVDNVNIIGS